MRIAQLAPPFESVPPLAYGGTERVVSTLTEELVRRGHDVTLFASGDSCTSARLVPVVERALWHLDPPCNDFAIHQAEIFEMILGRISPEKGLDIAIRIARRAGVPLLVAARPPLPFDHSPEVRRDRAYFEQVVQPLLSGSGVELIGEVGGPQKDQFLRNAAALLFPIRWPEPFGLVMPEALACGTPVLAFREGSVPEVIEDGITGILGHVEDD